MTKQSIAVVALFLASSNAARMERKAPKSINLFATGMNGDEDLGQDIIMKGDKFHYQQSLGEMTISESATPVKPVAAQAPVAAKPVVAAAPVKVVAPVQAAAPVKAAPVAVAAPLKAKAVVKAKGKGKDDGDDDAEEAKDGADVKKPGEATWEEHNDCKENEWEFGDGNCAFEAENLKIGRNDLVQVNNGENSDAVGLAQWSKHDFKGNPERVQIIDPVSYQEKANTKSYLGNRRTTFFAQGDDQPAGTNQGSNQLINTAKNLDWQETKWKNGYRAPKNVAVIPDTYGNVQAAGYEAQRIHDKESLFGKRWSLAQKFDTCANGSCQSPQWPGEILPGSRAILPKKSSPVDDGYRPTLNAVFDNRWNVQLNEQLNQRALAQVDKFDTCVKGSCQTPQWPGEILPGSKAILPKRSSPVDDGYRPTLNAVFDNRWN